MPLCAQMRAAPQPQFRPNSGIAKHFVSRYGDGMSMTVKIILIVSLFLIGSHLLLWGFIKRKLREAEARIAKEKAAEGRSDDGATPS